MRSVFLWALLLAIPIIWGVIAFIIFDPLWIAQTDGPTRVALLIVWAIVTLFLWDILT